MDDRRPRAEAVAISDGRVTWTGASSEARALTGSSTTVIDCAGGTLIPGFHDAHIHLLAYASSLAGVDCHPGAATSIEGINSAIRIRASTTMAGKWIRAWGYDESALAERRHPTRWDLDDAAPDHPVRLNHRSGHACVLNSVALDRVGIHPETPEPLGATIARDLNSGLPSGLLLEMDDYLDRVMPPLSAQELDSSLHRASHRLLTRGITSIQDATHTNSVGKWELFQGFTRSPYSTPRVTLMPDHRCVGDFSERGLNFGTGDAALRLGHAKIMVTASSGLQHPSPVELAGIVSDCVASGFPVAVHAVESGVVRSAAGAIGAGVELPSRIPSHRIEHCSECPPEVLRQVALSGATVVTQPGFVYASGDRYLETVDEEMQPHLYPIAALVRGGTPVAFGSDAPVVDPNPMPAVYSSVTRLTTSGSPLGLHQALDFGTALRAYTLGPAEASGVAESLGSLTPGRIADIVLFEEDIESVDPEALPSLRPAMTMMDGKVVSEA